jgi:hypothetical protein
MKDHLFPSVLCLVLVLAALIGGGVGGFVFAWMVWHWL